MRMTCAIPTRLGNGALLYFTVINATECWGIAVQSRSGCVTVAHTIQNVLLDSCISL